MVKSNKYKNKYPVYPGEFIPLIKIKDIDEEHKKRGTSIGTEPLMNITELKDSFKIEVALPGVKKEDFFVRICKNILSVIVLHKNANNRHFQLQEFSKNFERHISLPGKIDAQLVQAEYKEGILHLYLPKTDHPLKHTPARIVVY